MFVELRCTRQRGTPDENHGLRKMAASWSFFSPVDICSRRLHSPRRGGRENPASWKFDPRGGAVCCIARCTVRAYADSRPV